ncbi:MAG TPA: hypothetical protein VFJ14_01210 [Nocardioidaceae bacterium]|nr:hypothetical protein [Nocardioidaceae bacterium]
MDPADADHPRPTVVVGVLSAPSSGLAAAAPALDTSTVAAGIARELSVTHGDIEWSVEAVRPASADGAALPPTPAGDIGGLLSWGRAALLAHDVDLVVVLTDQPMQLHGRPVSAHVSPVQQSVVISVPALGARSGRRAATVAARLVLAAVEAEDPGESSVRAFRELATDADHDSEGIAFVTKTLRGSVRLLVGMVVANRPWLLTVRLSRTLVGAFAAAVIALVTPDVWLIADRLHPARLAVIALLVLAATTAVLAIGGGLLERAPSRRVRRTVIIHNTAVWVSVGLGVAALYVGLVVASVAATLLLLPYGLVAETVGHAVSAATLLRIGGLASVVALVGSAFGAGLEDDATVQRAAYTGSDDADFLDVPD